MEAPLTVAQGVVDKLEGRLRGHWLPKRRLLPICTRVGAIRSISESRTGEHPPSMIRLYPIPQIKTIKATFRTLGSAKQRALEHQEVKDKVMRLQPKDLFPQMRAQPRTAGSR